MIDMLGGYHHYGGNSDAVYYGAAYAAQVRRYYE